MTGTTFAPPEHAVSVVHDFRTGSEAHPDRMLVAERVGEEWAELTWGAGEITDQGYVNQRAVRERRSDDVVLLAAEPPAARVVVRENPAHA
jgi:hypothetical protein